MTADGARPRVLVVEDELMIRILLQDMLGELGYTVAGAAGHYEEAEALAADAAFDVAILDVNINGRDIYPVAETIAGRGLPFVFATGYGERGLPERYRLHPTLQKPFKIEGLQKTLANALPV
ncbi:MAG: response regulator [Pseudorhodoplanes sp.]